MHWRKYLSFKESDVEARKTQNNGYTSMIDSDQVNLDVNTVPLGIRTVGTEDDGSQGSVNEC